MPLTPDEKRRVVDFERHRLRSRLAPATPRPHHIFRVLMMAMFLGGLTLVLLSGRSLPGVLGVLLIIAAVVINVLRAMRRR